MTTTAFGLDCNFILTSENIQTCALILRSPGGTDILIILINDFLILIYDFLIILLNDLEILGPINDFLIIINYFLILKNKFIS